MSSIEVREIKFGSVDYESALRLRTLILREPLGLKFTREDLARDVNEIHFAAFSGPQLVGCLIMAPQERSVVKMRQVAVHGAAQGQGVGRRLVEVSEDWARARGFSMIDLNARQTAVPFYLSLGYEIEGEPFVEVTLPHRRMRKKLERS